MDFKKNVIVEGSNDLSKYGKDFQVKLLSLLIKDRAFSLSIIPIIKDLYFSDVYLRAIFVCIKAYCEKYPGAIPSVDNIKILLQDKGENILVYKKLLETIYEVNLEDRDFVVDNTRNFCFTKYALEEQKKVNEALKNGEFDKAQKIAIESFKYSGGYTAKIYDLKKDHAVIYDSERFRTPISFPFPTFTHNTKGGMGAGDLVITVAPSNFGKTAFATAVARHVNVEGKSVAYFSFEMGHESIFARYIAGLIDIPQEELKLENNRAKIEQKFEGGTYNDDKPLGSFKLIQERATNATVSAITAQLEYLKSTGFFPDIVFVDSLNQIKGSDGKWYKDDNARFEATCEDLRDLAGELSIPIHALAQTNRCLDSNTLVEIEGKGMIKLSEVEMADKILTMNGYKKITDKFLNIGTPVYKIKLKNGKEIICSDRHEFPVDDKLLSINSGLRIGDRLIVKN